MQPTEPVAASWAEAATEPEPVPWYDRISDRFNAILIKESRQSLKSRQFVATFMLVFAGLLASSLPRRRARARS